MAKLLVVEDNPDYQELLKNFLESACHNVITANTGTEALRLLSASEFDLILLDIMLPETNGYEVCKIIRRTSNIPIIMLTALESEAHQMQGYKLQIDDYITKPVSMPLLFHKIEAILRRTMTNTPEILCFENISLNLKTHTSHAKGHTIDFTLREFEIMQELMKVPGDVVTRKELLANLWGYGYYDDIRIVDTHIKNIRKKLSEYHCDYIETVRGIGYKLRKEIGKEKG